MILPNVGEPLRMSITRSISRPATARTSFPWYGFHWKWRPRIVPAFEKLSFIWRKSIPRRESRPSKSLSR